MQGLLIVDKPMAGTSFDVVAKLRGVLGTRKLGHSGTLDPMATGVLPVFCGGASKAVDLQLDHDKSYRAVLRLGARTDTGDITGTVLETAPVTAGEAELLAVLPQFVGKQMQVPPMYSAVKINGQPLYKLAREGKTVERKARPIEIYSIEYGGSPAAATASACAPPEGWMPAPSRGVWAAAATTARRAVSCWATWKIPRMRSWPRWKLSWTHRRRKHKCRAS